MFMDKINVMQENTSTEDYRDVQVVDDENQSVYIFGNNGNPGKKWYRSKTLWVNLIAILVLIIQTQTGFIISPEEQAAILAVINLILRWITGEPITA